VPEPRRLGNSLNTLRTYIVLYLGLMCFAAHADGVYFGGIGDTNTHWIGYRVSVTSNLITWTAYTLSTARHGRIKTAPAKFWPVGTNTWTAIFDEHGFQGNKQIIALNKHTIRLVSSRDPELIQIQDGKDILNLRRMSERDLEVLKSGRIPSPRSGANGSQPTRPNTNSTSPAVAPVADLCTLCVKCERVGRDGWWLLVA